MLLNLSGSLLLEDAKMVRRLLQESASLAQMLLAAKSASHYAPRLTALHLAAALTSCTPA